MIMMVGIVINPTILNKVQLLVSPHYRYVSPSLLEDNYKEGYSMKRGSHAKPEGMQRLSYGIVEIVGRTKLG